MGANASRQGPHENHRRGHRLGKGHAWRTKQLVSCLSFKSNRVHHAVPKENGESLPTRAPSTTKLPPLLFLHWWQHGLPAEGRLLVDAAVQVDQSELVSGPTTACKEIKWKKGDRIGCGAFGSVYMGLNCMTGELLAVKEVATCPRDGPHEKEAFEQLEQELAMLSSLSHCNIVRYLGTTKENSSLFIFLEYVPGGSIASLVARFGPLDEPVIKSYTRQLLAGLAYLHAQRILHRDIKGANLLVEKDGLVKLADFGMAKQMVEAASVTRSFKGSAFWMAPEVIRQQGHGAAADIWSVGCTVLEMATGKPPWSQCTSQVQAIFKIASSNEVPAIPEGLSPAAGEFIQLCLQRNPAARPSALQLLQHPFVTGVDVHVPPAPPLQLLPQQHPGSIGITPSSHGEIDAVGAASGRIRSSKRAAGKLDQQSQPAWLHSRNSSPKRGRAPAAAGRAGGAWGVADKGPGKAAASSGQAQSAPVSKQPSRGSSAQPASAVPAAVTAGAAPGGFRQLRSRLVASEDEGGVNEQSCVPVAPSAAAGLSSTAVDSS